MSSRLIAFAARAHSQRGSATRLNSPASRRAHRVMEQAAAELNLPVADPIRGGRAFDALLALLAALVLLSFRGELARRMRPS